MSSQLHWRCGFAAAAILALGCGAAGLAHAEDVVPVGNFGWLGVGKVYQLEKGHVFWVGEFSGGFTSDKGKNGTMDGTGWKCPGSNDLDFNSKKNRAVGYCLVSAPSGTDQAYAIWHCDGDTQTCSGVFDWTGGTGKYQGLTGHNTFVGHIQVNWPDGTASGYSTFNR